LKSIAGIFPVHVAVRDAMEFTVDQRRQFLESERVTAAPSFQ
jgi:hypothetical protein